MIELPRCLDLFSLPSNIRPNLGRNPVELFSPSLAKRCPSIPDRCGDVESRRRGSFREVERPSPVFRVSILSASTRPKMGCCEWPSGIVLDRDDRRRGRRELSRDVEEECTTEWGGLGASSESICEL